MKQLHLLSMLFLLVWSQACRGPEGLPGPQGLPGADGPPGDPGPAGGLEYGTVFDIRGSFTAANEYSLFFTFPPDEVEVYESDVVLAYIEWETTETSSVWRLLPQVQFMQQGIWQYNFDHTPTDISIFLDGQASVNFANLPAEYLNDQRFRVVILPAVFGGEKLSQNMDYSNYEEVVKRFKLSDKKVNTFTSSK